MQLSLHYSELFWAIKGFILYQIKQTALKSGYNFSTNSWTPAKLKNCKLENPSLLFRPLAQYLGSNKQQVLSLCITIVIILAPGPINSTGYTKT